MSSWKNEGGNRVSNIVNAQVDITNKYFSTDPTLAVNDREGIYYKKENGATVLGIGTKEPYSRFSFGDFISNNYDGDTLYSESLVNTPTIALTERPDGTNATGLSFFYNRAGSGESRGIRFTVNNNNQGTIFNSSLEPQAISDDNTLMLITNDGEINSVLINTTTTNFANPKSGLEINGEIRATNGIVLKGIDSQTVDKQAGLIFYDTNDKKIKWCTGSGDDIKSVVATGEEGFVINTEKYDSNFAVIQNSITESGVLAFKDMAFVIGNGSMLETRFIGSDQQNATYLKQTIPAFSIIGQTTGADDYNANVLISHIDYVYGEQLLSGTCDTDLSMNGVMYLLNNLAIDVFNPKSIIDVSKNNVPFLDIGYNNINYMNSVVIGSDLSGSKQSFYFGENILNNGSEENMFNMAFGKNITVNGENNNYNLIFGSSNNLNNTNNKNNLIFGTGLTVESDVSYCFVMGNGGTVEPGDLMKYFQEGFLDEVFSLKNGGDLFTNGNLSVGTIAPKAKLHIHRDFITPRPSDFSHRAVLIEGYTADFGGECSIHLKDTTAFFNNKHGQIISLVRNNIDSMPTLCFNSTENDVIDTNHGLFLNYNGYVGIGIDVPLANLHIRNHDTRTEGDVVLRAEGTIRTYAFDQDIDIRSEITNDKDGGKLQLYDGTQGNSDNNIKTKLSSIDGDDNYINNNSNFGLGTDAPDEKLHVFGNLKVGGANISSIQLWNGVNDYIYLYSESGNGNIVLLNKTNGETDREQVKISANDISYFNGGNVGIKTNNPIYPLVVNGEVLLTGENKYLYFHDTDTSISYVDEKLVFKTANTEVISITNIANISATTIAGELRIEDLVIKGLPFDAAAAASWNTTSSIIKSINVGFGVGINYNNSETGYRNFMPHFTLDVNGNTRATNLFLGNIIANVVPEKLTGYIFEEQDINNIQVGLYTINELNTDNTKPAWQLFDNNNSTICTLTSSSVSSTDYIALDSEGNITSGNVEGAYVDIVFPKLWSIRKYALGFNDEIDNNDLPKKWAILGKTYDPTEVSVDQNENTWKLIELIEYSDNWKTDLEDGVVYKIFEPPALGYRDEKISIIRFVILETYNVGDPTDSEFSMSLSRLQFFGEISDINIQNVNFIQTTLASDDVTDDNKNLILQPYGNFIGINNTTPEVILDITDTGAIRLPVGTEQQGLDLGNIVNDKKGYIRFNTTKNHFEGYFGIINEIPTWKSLGGLVDADQDTYITAEEIENENALKFYTQGVRRLVIDMSGNYDISSNLFDLSANTFNVKADEFTVSKDINVSRDVIVKNDLSANKIVCKNINLDNKKIRTGKVMQKTHPEDSIVDMFVVNSQDAVFDVTYDNDYEMYYFYDVPNPTIKVYPGSIIQFNLDLVDNSFNIFVGSEQNINGIDVSGIVFVDENNDVVDYANDKLKGTLYWHVPYDAVGNYRYQSTTMLSVKGDITVLPSPTDIVNHNIITDDLSSNIVYGNICQLNTITNSTIHTNYAESNDISTNTLYINDRVGVNFLNPTVAFEIDGDSSFRIPGGPESTREIGIVQGTFGYMRFNETSNQFEGFDGNNWMGLGGVVSVDQETKITAQDNTIGQDGIGSLIMSVDNTQAMVIIGGGIDETRKVGINTSTPKVILDINDTGAIKIPTGSSVQRDNLETENRKGFLRFNNQNLDFEGYDGTNWFSLGSNKTKVIDNDLDTYITVDSESNIDEDTIRFYTVGVEQLNISNTGIVNIKENIVVNKDLYTDRCFSDLINSGSRVFKNSEFLKKTNPENSVGDSFNIESEHAFFDVIYDESLTNYKLNDIEAPTIYAYPGTVLEFHLVDTETNNFKIFKGLENSKTGTDVSGLVHTTSDNVLTNGVISSINSGNLFWHIPQDAIGNYRYQSETRENVNGNIVILPRVFDISNNITVTNNLIINNDLSGNNAILHDVSVNRLWIGQVEMIGYIPGNISNPIGLGELVGDFKVTENTMLQSLDISKNIYIKYESNLEKHGIEILGDSGYNISQFYLHGSTNGIKVETNNDNENYYAMDVNNNTSSLLKIINNGNIGIFNSSPETKLDVNGSIKLRSVKSNNNEVGIYFREGSDYSEGGDKIYNCSILSYKHYGDKTDGLSLNGHNGISFCTGSDTRNENMRISHDGNIGIGTEEPKKKLHISYGTNTSGVGIGLYPSLSKTSGIYFAGTNTHMNDLYYPHIYAYEPDTTDSLMFMCKNDFVFYNTSSFNHDENTETVNMKLTADGKLGIGTESIDEKLHLKDGNFLVEGGTNNADSIIKLKSNNGKTNTILTDNTTGNLILKSLNGDSTYNNICLLDTGGKVGVGTSSPDYLIDIIDSNNTGESVDIMRVFSEKNSSEYSETNIKIEKSNGNGGYISGFNWNNIGSGITVSSETNNNKLSGMQIIQKENEKTSKISIGSKNPVVHLDIDPELHYHLYFRTESMPNVQDITTDYINNPIIEVFNQNGVKIIDSPTNGISNGLNITIYSNVNYDDSTSTGWSEPTVEYFNFDTGLSSTAGDAFTNKISQLINTDSVDFIFINARNDIHNKFYLSESNKNLINDFGFNKLLKMVQEDGATGNNGYLNYPYSAIIINHTFSEYLTGVKRQIILEDGGVLNDQRSSIVEYYLTPENLVNVGPGCASDKFDDSKMASFSNIHSGAVDINDTKENGRGIGRGVKNSSSISILAPGSNQEAKLYFGTQYRGFKDYAKKSAIICNGTSIYGSSYMHFCLNNTNSTSTYSSAKLNRDEVLTLTPNGIVSIGNNNPNLNNGSGLEIFKKLKAEFVDENGQATDITDKYKTHNESITQLRIKNGLGTNKEMSLEIGLLNSGRGVIQPTNSENYNHLDLNPAGGLVTVGRETSTNNSGLVINGYHTTTNGRGQLYYNHFYDGYSKQTDFKPAYTPAWYNMDIEDDRIGISCHDYTIIARALVITSDRRIKENIVEIPKNLSLEKMRNIKCNYFNYIDKIKRGNNRDIGFIAQEVNKHFPDAVNTQKGVVPLNMQKIINPNWEEILVNNKKQYKLSIPNFDGIEDDTYTFYVMEGKNELELNIQYKDNTFIFNKKWEEILLYGKHVNDFHTLDKQKLFTLNFSATQEIDNIQQNEIERLNKANQKIAELEEKNKKLEDTLELVLKRLSKLEKN